MLQNWSYRPPLLYTHHIDSFLTNVSIRIADIHLNAVTQHGYRKCVISFKTKCLKKTFIRVEVHHGWFKNWPRNCGGYIFSQCESSRWHSQNLPWGCARNQWLSKWRHSVGWGPKLACGIQEPVRISYTNKMKAFTDLIFVYFATDKRLDKLAIEAAENYSEAIVITFEINFEIKSLHNPHYQFSTFQCGRLGLGWHFYVCSGFSST